ASPLGNARDYANQANDSPPIAIAPPAYYPRPGPPPVNAYSAPYYRPPVYGYYGRPYYGAGALAGSFPNYGGNIRPPTPPLIMNRAPGAVFPYVPPTIPMVRFHSAAIPPASPMLMRTFPRR
ncbi:MAG: hypothetical protein ACREP6_06885, partial [Candidatus Binataceae bacterium]